MVTRASPKRADNDTFSTALPAKAEDERDMVVAAIALLRPELSQRERGSSMRWLERT
uniref:Uncharacterized protein n=1 Tax=Triticum urartu TaxID=4572 RepID=A0A8R7V0V1_TRIUA